MKVEIDICEIEEVEDNEGNINTKQVGVYQDIEDWDTCETTSQVYRAAMREYGRCKCKVYIDTTNGYSRHIGWIFLKRRKYTNCDGTYLQETCVVPLKKYEVKHVVEYAL